MAVNLKINRIEWDDFGNIKEYEKKIKFKNTS